VGNRKRGTEDAGRCINLSEGECRGNNRHTEVSSWRVVLPQGKTLNTPAPACHSSLRYPPLSGAAAPAKKAGKRWERVRRDRSEKALAMAAVLWYHTHTHTALALGSFRRVEGRSATTSSTEPRVLFPRVKLHGPSNNGRG
jgi:hypothetical protein